MIDDHEWRGAEVRRNFGVLSLSFQTVRRMDYGKPERPEMLRAEPRRQAGKSARSVEAKALYTAIRQACAV